MKRHVFLLATAAFALPAAALSPQGGISHHAMPAHGAGLPDVIRPDVIWVNGTIQKVDAAAGNVVIAHGPIDNLDMSAKTMPFKVSQRGWLATMKEGQHIRFVADYVHGALTVMRWLPTR